MIELKKVTKLYNTNGTSAIGIQNVDLNLSQNEIVIIVGDSGAGKTTLMNVLTGIDTYEEGEMFLDGRSTSDFTNEDFDNFRNNNVGFIFQNYNLIENYTVLDNVIAPLLARGVSLSIARKKAKEIIKEVGLSHRLRTRANKLSGGEKQRCVIARALVVDSKILACDEPTGNLDSATSKEIIELIARFSKDKLVLIVTHDYESFENIATRRLVMKDGHLIEDVNLKKVNSTNLDLDFSLKNKIKFSSSLYLSSKNLLTSPKRSIFSSILFFIQFFIVSFLLIFIANYNPTYTSYVQEKSSYLVNDFKTLMIYPSQEQDFEDLVNEEALSFKSTNDFFNCSLNLKGKELIAYINRYKYYIRPYFEEEEGYQLVEGSNKISSSNEIILVFNNANCLDVNFKSTINEEIYFSFNTPIINQDFYLDGETFLYQDNYKIVGVLLNEQLNDNYVIINHQEIISLQDEYEAKLDLTRSFYNGYLNSKNLKTNLKSTQNYFVDHLNFISISLYKNKLIDLVEEVKPNTIYIDKSINIDDFYIKYNNYQLDLSKYEIDNSYDLSYGDNYYYILPEEMVESFFGDEYCYKVYYKNQEQVSNDYEKLNQKGIYSETTIDQLSKKTIVAGYSFFVMIAIILFLFLILILVVSFGRVILNIIYGSKKNNYVIYKTIGFNENKIRIIDILEILLLTLIVYTINVLVVNYIFSTGHAALENEYYKHPLFYIISLILMSIISLTFIIKFENKVFNKSIASTLKAGDYLD